MNIDIGCIIMASGRSVRYGKNKLLEKLGNKEIILHTADRFLAAGYIPLVVTRSKTVKELLEREGVSCVLHDGALKSDTMHVGLKNLSPDLSGYLFMPGDQPLVLPDSLRKLAETFREHPEQALRLGFNGIGGSPVMFPAALRANLLAYTGDRGGMDVLRAHQISCNIIEAAFAWELFDVDTPQKMEEIRRIYEIEYGRFDKKLQA